MDIKEKLVDTFISKKFVAFVTGTVLFCTVPMFDVNSWLILTGIFIGSQSVVDVISSFKGKKNETSPSA